MRIKSVDIARKLGISKATVSLALNDKPGVSERTKREILECKQKLENGQMKLDTPATFLPETGKHIKVLRISKALKHIRDAELDLWTDVYAVFEKYARIKGYSLSLMYLDFYTEDINNMTKECNAELVAAVIVLATELDSTDLDKLKKIKKPLVIYDCDLNTSLYPSILINNRQGIHLAINELMSKGNKDILYFANSMDIYNFKSRRRGFCEIMSAHGMSNSIVKTGSTIDEVYLYVMRYIADNKLPQAIILENYQVSVGTIRALKNSGVNIPSDISLIGIDMLPSFMTGDLKMTSIRIPHTERAYWAMQMLFKEIEDPVELKSTLYTDCILIDGNTVALRQ